MALEALLALGLVKRQVTSAKEWAEGSDDPSSEKYQNSAKYYSEQAETAKEAAETAQGLAEDARDGVSKVNISASQDGLGASITVTDKDGVDTTVHVYSLTEVNNWNDVRNAVRLGLGATLFPVGYEFTVAKDGCGNLTFVVRAHDHHVATNDRLTHTMTLEAKHVYGTTAAYKGLQYDAPEAFYYAESGLAAGQYNFKLLTDYDATYGGGKTYEFTLAQAVPIGGVLTFPWGYNVQASTVKVYSWASNSDTTGIENVSVAEGTGGTALGEVNGTGNLNHTHRTRYGSNNYMQSAVRQWLNSAGALGAVWTPQTKFDRPPTSHTSVDAAYVGFQNGLDADFLAVVEEATIPYRTNSVHEVASLDTTAQAINTVYSLSDKFFLLSRPEIYGDWDSATYKDGEYLDYYNGLTNTERIKYDAFSTARYAWLRSPIPGYAYFARRVNTDGSLYYNDAYYSGGVAPACIIA